MSLDVKETRSQEHVSNETIIYDCFLIELVLNMCLCLFVSSTVCEGWFWPMIHGIELS
jgi:hypothetical protein